MAPRPLRLAPRRLRLAPPLLVAAALALALPAATIAQAAGSTPPDTTVYTVDPVVVTATRGPRELSRIPQPVSVLQRRDLERSLPNTVSDLFRSLPGLDVTGVGVNQGRPQIRGLKGQRILLLGDGLRLNNTRRQQDFGELPALIDVTGVERVEVVRGPASVLYGSDAIGGVVNIITRAPRLDGVHGTGSLRYGGVENQRTGSIRVLGRSGRFSVRAGGTAREADPYVAPAGSFGAITLADDALVTGSGTKDQTADVRLGFDTGSWSAFAKVERYDSEDSGFGSVDPALYAPMEAEIRITYPMQTFHKVSGGVRAAELGGALADQLEVLAYGQDNERQLRFGIGPFPTGPGMTMEFDNLNSTDIRTYGSRVEARKLAHPRVLLTYGLDLWRDRAIGTDENTTYMTGFGPVPITSVDDRPQLPEASSFSAGAFVQGEVEAGERVSLVGGARWQRVNAQTYATPGLESQVPVDITDGTVVAALNSVVRITSGVSLVGTVGRGFRSPNLIERFFDGPTPEGRGYQVRNPELVPETSLNVDLGVRVRRGRVGGEVFTYRNRIHNGVRIEPLGTVVGGMPAFQMTNVDELLLRGVEVAADANLGSGLTALASYTWMDSEDRNDVESPVGDAFSNKQTATLRYDHPQGRAWIAGQWRRNGTQKDVDLGTNPIGPVLPAFNVVDLRSGVTVLRSDAGMTHRLTIALTNLTNELYAEFANASFFRPEPKRNLTLAWEVSF